MRHKPKKAKKKNQMKPERREREIERGIGRGRQAEKCRAGRNSRSAWEGKGRANCNVGGGWVNAMQEGESSERRC